MNVEEYAYDFAGNRIAKIGEISTTYYLVDTNGALSQVLAEYDENGTLKTNYTRADELISQERDGAKSYYLYDGSDSVRMLANEEGEITDTYTFDAFGNLTASTGSTKNDFLYRGEQYDSFTGLYYLRARYMNPATGTFITMDEYAGSVFEPVSLHKYLYANANPVMYSDPSGYSSLSELTTTMAVQGVINGIKGACVGGMLNSLLTLLRGGNASEFQQAFIEGMISGFFIGGAFGALGVWASECVAARYITAIFTAVLAGLSLRSAIIDFEKGYYFAGIIEAGTGVILIFSSFHSAIIGGRIQSASSVKYPPNNGAVPGTEKTVTLEPGTTVGRYGEPSETSVYLTKPGTPIEQLSLPPGQDSSQFIEYFVAKPIPEVTEGIIAPWWGQPGGGTQYITPYTLNWQINNSYLIER